MTRPAQYLRPYLHLHSRLAFKPTSSAYLRYYNILHNREADPDFLKPVWRHQLLKGETECPKWLYPRHTTLCHTINRRILEEWGDHLEPDTLSESKKVMFNGRVTALRLGGKHLLFLSVVDRSESTQIVCNYAKIENAPEPEAFQTLIRSIAKGDIYSFVGNPCRTKSGELSISLTAMPRLLSPCLRPFVDSPSQSETTIRNPHIEYWTDKLAVERFLVRSSIINYIRKFLDDSGHVEVQTPILSQEAGGAVARPFHTSATEFPDRQISLRIAPELWLKRLVLGGLPRVFELGPCFRNEGLDAHHNPEFTTCEFYRAYANLGELIFTTEKLFSEIDKLVRRLNEEKSSDLPDPSIESAPPFGRLEFIPTIEACLNERLPKLDGPNATEQLLAIFRRHELPIPGHPTLPRLLDKLATKFIEPHCQAPTFIMYHPECLAPLAKSFFHGEIGQRVAASAELFVKGHEIANMYEEENSPFEQRRKFEEALKYREGKASPDGTPSSIGINESYIEALEWGLPPTGGWGCGIDRLVMLFTGANRIGDVLTFGTLRNVVTLGRAAKAPKNSSRLVQQDESVAQLADMIEQQERILGATAEISKHLADRDKAGKPLQVLGEMAREPQSAVSKAQRVAKQMAETTEPEERDEEPMLVTKSAEDETFEQTTDAAALKQMMAQCSVEQRLASRKFSKIQQRLKQLETERSDSQPQRIDIRSAAA